MTLLPSQSQVGAPQLRLASRQLPADVKPEDITCRWTFNGRWNPEAKIRQLWPIIGYEKLDIDQTLERAKNDFKDWRKK